MDILHVVTKPVVDAAFLRDWLGFLSQEQQFSVHLFYSEAAFRLASPEDLLTDWFPAVQLHRIEKVFPHPARRQPAVFLADYLDLRYLSTRLEPALIHTHDSRSLLLARYFFPDSARLHSWWMEDRSAHRYWRATLERLSHWRTWETVEGDPDEIPALSPLLSRQYPLPTPMTLDGEYRRGRTFTTLRELYRSILRSAELRTQV